MDRVYSAQAYEAGEDLQPGNGLRLENDLLFAEPLPVKSFAGNELAGLIGVADRPVRKGELYKPLIQGFLSVPLIDSTTAKRAS